MEILQSDDLLRQEIISDAKTKAERIIKKAERDAEEITGLAEKDIGYMKEEYKKSIIGAAEEKAKRLFASADIEINKNKTRICGELVDGVYSEVMDSVRSDKPVAYKDFIFALIKKQSSLLGGGDHSVRISDKEKISAEDLYGLKFQGGRIKEASVDPALAEGLVLYSSDKKTASYITLEEFFERLKDGTRMDLYNMIVKGTNDG